MIGNGVLRSKKTPFAIVEEVSAMTDGYSFLDENNPMVRTGKSNGLFIGICFRRTVLSMV